MDGCHVRQLPVQYGFAAHAFLHVHCPKPIGQVPIDPSLGADLSAIHGSLFYWRQCGLGVHSRIEAINKAREMELL